MSPLFIALASGFSALLMLFLTLGLRRKLAGADQGRRSTNVQAYQDNLQRLEDLKAQESLAEGEYEHAKQTLDRSVLAEHSAKDEWQKQPLPLWGAALVAVVTIAFALGGFLASDGRQHFQDPNPQPRTLEDMVASLSQRLQAQPDDTQGWVTLARAYAAMGRHADSATAYAEVNRLTRRRDPSMLLNEAEALGMAQQHDLSGKPRALIEEALALRGDHPQALWYAFLAAKQARDETQAQQYLASLSALPDLPEELRQILQKEFGVNAAAPVGLVFDIDVSLNAMLQGQLADKNTDQADVFIFARAQSGPPMPLAVQRVKLSALPLRVQLDDSMSMVDGMKLSAFDAWELVARVSFAGGPQAQAGDWEGRQLLNQAPDAVLSLIIDTIVE